MTVSNNIKHNNLLLLLMYYVAIDFEVNNLPIRYFCKLLNEGKRLIFTGIMIINQSFLLLM